MHCICLLEYHLSPMARAFDPACSACPRLADYLDSVRRRYPHYHAAPVPAFGPSGARLLVVGLAPGLHGANATGRPFTGDHAGILLYRTLHGLGLASRPEALGPDDGMELRDCRITNAVRCVPPANKPEGAEVQRCRDYLAWDLERVPEGGVVLALGRVAHDAVLAAESLVRARHPFAHGARHGLSRGRTLVDCYHCSRYNTQTGRLTEAMFREVFAQARRLLEASDP